MKRRFVLLPLALAVLAGACEEETLSLEEGTPSSLAVRAYVDADGDGAFDVASDVPITGATVSLAGATDLSATTGADGVATFAEVPPGAYQATLSGTVPEGAVLSSAVTVTVTAPFQGADLDAEFRFAFQPGTISGVLFRDDDMSGDFDPAFDTPAAGVPVALVSGSDTLQTTATDGEGGFVFTGVRPGDYTVVVTPFETIEIVGGNEIPVTVGASATVTAQVQFTGNLVIPVADARDAQGSVVTVEAVVTFAPSYSTSTAFFQDETGGMSVFEFDLSTLAGRDLMIGDSIRITGLSTSFRSEVQLNDITALEILATVAEPDARSVTATDINAATFAGELVTIDGTVLTVDTLSFGNQYVLLEDAAADTFAVFGDSRTGVTTASWEAGQTYAVTGVLGTDDRDPFPHRVEVRSTGDVVLGGSVIDIADARTMDGETVTVEGVVTWAVPFNSPMREVFLQDGTAGISLFDFDLEAIAGVVLQEGDRIRVRGTVGSFRSEVQLGNATLVSVLGNEAVPAAREVTAAEINAGMFQGELVMVTGATVVDVTVLSFGNQRVELTDGSAGTFYVYGDSRTGVVDTDWNVGEVYTVTGVLGTDDRDTPAPRLEVRQPSDVNQTS